LIQKLIFINNKDFILVNQIRTVNWPELLPKITINIDPKRFHPIPTG
jgi:hypothetical protein